MFLYLQISKEFKLFKNVQLYNSDVAYLVKSKYNQINWEMFEWTKFCEIDYGLFAYCNLSV